MSLILPRRLLIGGQNFLVVFADHGDITDSFQSNGGVMGSLTSTGDFTIFTYSWEDASNISFSDVSINGTSMTIQVNTGSSTTGALIATYPGALSGDVTMSFSGSATIDRSAASLVSLTGLPSYSVADTDTTTGTSMTALTTPGAGGIRLITSMNASDTAQTFSGVDAEFTDISVGGGARHSGAYIIADSSATIGMSSNTKAAGISIGV